MDDSAPAGLERPEHHPVADGRKLPPRDDPVAEAAGDGGQQVRMARVHRIDMLVLEGDARGNEAFSAERLEIRRESIVPTQRVKLHDPEGTTAAGQPLMSGISRGGRGVLVMMLCKGAQDGSS